MIGNYTSENLAVRVSFAFSDSSYSGYNKFVIFYQVGNQAMTKDIDFVRLNLDPLATTIQGNARAWVKELGKFLNESAREDLNALKAEIEVIFHGIHGWNFLYVSCRNLITISWMSLAIFAITFSANRLLQCRPLVGCLDL